MTEDIKERASLGGFYKFCSIRREFAEKYFKKGTKLVVVARCQTRTYTNNEGKKVYVTEFIVEDQEFAESKRAAGGEPETEKDGFMQMPEGEELPFN